MADIDGTMTILAMDTATMVSSVAVAQPDRVLAELTAETRFTHSETLVVNIEGIARAASAPSMPVEYMNPSTFSRFLSSSVVLTKKIRMICSEQK